MLIKDLDNTFYFTQNAFYLSSSSSGMIKMYSAHKDTLGIWIGDNLDQRDAMDYIYQCYKRGERCCDLNDLKKDKK